ncbi:MAG: hypothetical protein ACPLVJ_00155 [Candidatus Bathyarchaeales archaeon]
MGLVLVASPKLISLRRKQKQRLIDLLCLKILARDGTEWGYDLYKKLKESELPRFLKSNKIKPFEFYSSMVDRSLHRLEKCGFIKKSKGPVKSKKGPPKIPCSLTLFGLLRILEISKEPWGYIDEIAVKHADKLPVIFGAWKHFKEKQVENKVIEALKIFCKTYMPHWYTSKGLDKIDDFLREDLTRSILYFHLGLITLPPLDRVSEQRRREIIELEKKRTFDWVKVWFENEKLREYLIKELDYDEREHEQRLAGIKLVKEQIKKLNGLQLSGT